MARYLYSELAQLVDARKRCLSSSANDSQREWADKHEEKIQSLVREFMPSGSGLDAGTKIDLDASHADKLIFTTSFHHMSDGGFYDGWTEHVVTVTPSLAHGYHVRVSGRDRNRIKDYIVNQFTSALDVDLSQERAA